MSKNNLLEMISKSFKKNDLEQCNYFLCCSALSAFCLKFNFFPVMQEIKDRENWLKEMEELGEGNKYKLIIEQQIQEKVREMNRLHTKISTQR